MDLDNLQPNASGHKARKRVGRGHASGTGKTAGFGLPMLQRLLPHANSSMSPARHPVRGLVLTPTRELAVQISEVLAALEAAGIAILGVQHLRQNRQEVTLYGHLRDR